MLPLSGGWRIGCPVAEAMTNTSSKKHWDSQEFWIYIPLALKRDKDVWKDYREIRRAVLDTCVGVDNVRIFFYSSRDTLLRRIRVWPESHTNAGQIAADPAYGLFRREYMSLLLDTLTIPAAEDSIDVAFTAWVKQCAGAEDVQKEFSFRLYRREGKQLYFDPGW